MDRRILFIETLDDITKRAVDPPQSEYEVLMVTLPLRKLLLEGNPLMHQLNRAYRVPIDFDYHDVGPPQPPLPVPVFWSSQDGLDPGTSPRRSKLAVRTKVDAFLKQPILLVNGELFSVKDVIEHVAYVAGAIHPGSAVDERAQMLEGVSKTIQIGGLDPMVRSLRAIGRVTLRALGPLRQAVEADLAH